MKEDEYSVLRDVEMRLRALAEARRLAPMLNHAQEHLVEAKQRAAAAPPGTLSEQQYLREASEVSLRLAGLQAELWGIEQELRRTRYLIQFLQE